MLTLGGPAGSIERLSRSLSTARVDLNPHQVDAALFAIRSPLSKGVIFAACSSAASKNAFYDAQRFDSDSERRFSILLEDDPDVLKWLKPTKKVFEIDYRNGEIYEPDFIVQTKTGKWICEPKRASEMSDETVLAKARAAATWCQHASTACNTPWGYLLIPHDRIGTNMTFAGFIAAHHFVT